MRRGTGTTAAVAAAGVALLLTPGAAAKAFEPGDVRLCGAEACVTLRDRAAGRALGAFFYHGLPPARSRPVPLGAPALQLRYRNRYVPGIVAGARLDRFLSYGVDPDRFRRGRWYRLPARAAAALRRMAAGITPMRVTPAALRRSR